MSRPALLDKLFQAGEWLLKPGLVPIDDVTIKRNQTTVYVALDALIRQGGGLAVGQDKRIYVDFSLMPTDTFEDLLKSIRVPVWLTKNLTIYVATTGSDTLDEGRGLTEDKPFATLQAALQYVTDTYNVSNYIVTVRVEAGDYGLSETTLPDYTSSTGFIIITGSTANAADTLLGRIRSVATKTYRIQNLTARTADTSVAVISPITADSTGIVEILGCISDISTVSVGSGGVYGTYSNKGGSISIVATADTSAVTGLVINAGTNTIRAFIGAAASSKITINADLTLQGSPTMTEGAASCNNGYIAFGRTSPANPGRFPQVNVTGSPNGRRYYAYLNGIINTNGQGPDFLPGSTEGVTATGGQYA